MSRMYGSVCVADEDCFLLDRILTLESQIKRLEANRDNLKRELERRELERHQSEGEVNP